MPDATRLPAALPSPGCRRADAVSAAQAGGETPLAYMIRVMNDPHARASRRDQMARTAAFYLHARLAHTDKVPDPFPGPFADPPVSLSHLTKDELAQFKRLCEKAIGLRNDVVVDPAET